ncbi:hypothetical protein GW17_00034407 [Ensete ventricosum]|nr:hypothetical protein GW17_00034407 [Ensete ventricosum]
MIGLLPCRSGILQDRKGFTVLVLHSTEEQTAASLSTMSTIADRLTILITGMMNFLTRLAYQNPQHFHLFYLETRLT